MDPISDMFIRLKNAYRAGHRTVKIPYSKFKYEVAKTLSRAGFIGNVERKGRYVKKVLSIQLLYDDGRPLISDIKLISKPGRRIYKGYRDIRSLHKRGIVLISTPKGVLSDGDAKREKVGGELLAEIR